MIKKGSVTNAFGSWSFLSLYSPRPIIYFVWGVIAKKSNACKLQAKSILMTALNRHLQVNFVKGAI